MEELSTVSLLHNPDVPGPLWPPSMYMWEGSSTYKILCWHQGWQNRGYSWASFKGPPTELLLDPFSGIVPLPSPRPTSKEQKVQRMDLRLNTRTQPMEKELLFPPKHGGGGTEE